MAQLKNLTVNDTGFIRLPSGTTNQRPGSPTVGMIRYNTDISSNEYWNGSSWIRVEEANVGATSTGGAITTSAGYRIHTFTSGTNTFVPSKDGTVEVLVLAGGGGGEGIGGGGGAGGYIYVSGVPVIAGTSYPAVVGAGGAGGTSHGANNSQNGGDSVFGGGTPIGITATGGGRGRTYPPAGAPTATIGGSGGGGPGWNGGPETIHAGSGGTAGQGHPGGVGAHYNGTPTGTHYGGGGGGGAGSIGYGRSNRFMQGRGGEGMASNIGGSVVWRAGGGAGGTHSAPTHGSFSLAGRGSNGNNLPGQTNPGGTNNGGGGAGANHSSPDVSGNGGPGVVIVRYRG
jgi:hypothetical protein